MILAGTRPGGPIALPEGMREQEDSDVWSIHQLYHHVTPRAVQFAEALTLCTVLLIKHGKLKWAWVTGVPLAWDAVVTLTASYQKVFSGDPKLGFFAQRDRFQDAIAAGEVLPPAKNLDDMNAVVTNSTVDGVLAAFFAILIIVVILDATRISIKAIRSREPLPTSEVPAQESELDAPDGLFDRKLESVS